MTLEEALRPPKNKEELDFNKLDEKTKRQIINFLEHKDDEVEQAIPYSQKRKIEIHKELTEKIHNLYKTKNMDYGDSMHPLFKEYGLTAFLILFETKINRIKTLQHRKGNYESLNDSLMDLANYALIALTELDYDAENTKMEE